MVGVILFADNDPGFLKARKEFLEEEGYQVIPAVTVAEAQKILDRGGVDLAILDLRLRDDGDDKDISGLSIARKSDPSIPKIIHTKFPTMEMVRDALGPSEDGRPPVEDFVAKNEGAAALLAKVRKGISKRRDEELRLMKKVVVEMERFLGEPLLQNYRGFFCMLVAGPDGNGAATEGLNVPSVSEGDSCRVIVWLQPDEPENVFSEAINIRDGKDAEEVRFEVLLDSRDIKFAADRKVISVRHGSASERFDFPFTAPPTSGLHDVYAEVFQKNMLVQVVKGTVHVDVKRD